MDVKILFTTAFIFISRHVYIKEGGGKHHRQGNPPLIGYGVLTEQEVYHMGFELIPVMQNSKASEVWTQEFFFNIVTIARGYLRNSLLKLLMLWN